MRNFKSIGLSGMAAAAAITLGLSAAPSSAVAQPQVMAEIFPFASNFCPRGTAALDGQLLPISSYSALFSLLGTVYGGDGRTTFALPDMRGRTAFAPGPGPGLTNHRLGAKGGTTTTTVQTSQLPSHTHQVTSVNQVGDKAGPASDFFAKASDGAKTYHNGPADAAFDPAMVRNTGGGQPLNITQPYLAVTWCIVMTGVYPSRS